MWQICSRIVVSLVVSVSQHFDMSRCWDVANFCPLVVFVAGVRVVEFGSYVPELKASQPRL